MPWFVERGYTCHALNLRGHGGSSGEALGRLLCFSSHGEQFYLFDTNV